MDCEDLLLMPDAKMMWEFGNHRPVAGLFELAFL